jgi:hypothetical protein
MAEKNRARLWLGAPFVASSLMLAGCMGSPTYGTDKTATEQLASDVTGILSIAPKRRDPIDYKPRPDLVKPAPGAAAALPAPQDSVTVASNPSWPESPEQRRARIRAEATANQNNPNYDSPVVSDVAVASAASSSSSSFGLPAKGDDSGSNQSIRRPEFKNTREAYKKRLAETKQGSETSRKYLSEPPLTYRQPAATAPVDDIGEDEFKKERRARAAARKKGDWSWRQLIPGM